MKVTYTTYAKPRCPVDHKLDNYEVTIISDRVIMAEILNETLKEWATKEAFQEDFTVELAREFGCYVRTVGTHSGVRTVAEAGGHA